MLKEFAKAEFSSFHYFNFEQDRRLLSIFNAKLDTKKILDDLSILAGKKINSATDCIIFDEIQECSRALTSLKYFCEDMPELAVLSAGSLLGVALSQESFPVGKVDFLHLYPMTFQEFLIALEDEMGLQLIDRAVRTGEMSLVGHEHLWSRLKEYYITGGMPEVVATYLSLKDADAVTRFEKIRHVQQNLIDSYNKDFAKHAGKVNSMHILAVFENVPVQLARNIDGSVQRFQFKDVVPRKKGFAALQGPITWLEQAGLIIKVKICNRAEIPLESFCQKNIFKLYLIDIGLLGCMLRLPQEALVAQDYGMTKGYFAESFVAQELLAQGQPLYSWSEVTSEIEFLNLFGSKIVPIEVKAGHRTKARSLGQFLLRYKPKRAIKLSAKPLNLNRDNLVQNYPLYMVGWLGNYT